MNSIQTKNYIDSKQNEYIKEDLIRENDETFMPLPDFESAPHLLISKVRKHYMDYIVKLLCTNYEKHQNILNNQNHYLPRGIWRCAKNMEMEAARTCMVVSLYQKNIVKVMKELKKDTEQGQLNKKLHDCLLKPYENEKKIQTLLLDNCNCQCNCGKTKKRRKLSTSPKGPQREDNISLIDLTEETNIQHTPAIQDLLANATQAIQDDNLAYKKIQIPTQYNHIVTSKQNTMSVESQDSDDIVMQLAKMFQSESMDDDLFEYGLLCDSLDPILQDSGLKAKLNKEQFKHQDTVSDSQSNNDDINQGQQEKPETSKLKKFPRKWLCEEFFLKTRYLELMDQLGDSNRRKLTKVKDIMTNLFGDDSDDECIMSPMEETADFIISCKQRIAPWVVHLLTPLYIKGRIKGKSLFKGLAKHLISLIYQCSKYPEEFEVTSFVNDFLENHKIIRCEADFKQFKIDNLGV